MHHALSNARKSNLINIPFEKNNDKSKNGKLLPNVMLLNARSLINKTDELELLVITNDIDIACITETWLKETVPDKAVAVSGMTLVRNDRTYGTGGGVALYVNNKIPFKIRKDLNDPLLTDIYYSQTHCLQTIYNSKVRANPPHTKFSNLSFKFSKIITNYSVTAFCRELSIIYIHVQLHLADCSDCSASKRRLLMY
jgi:hypothetical protein